MYDKSLWVKDLQWGGKQTAFWVSVTIAGRSQSDDADSKDEQGPVG